MLGVFVTFRYEKELDGAKVRAIAAKAARQFEGMAGLRFKAFTLIPERREAINFYVWDTDSAAKAFFTEQMMERIASLYGVRPAIQYAEIATLVDNGPR